MSELILYLNSDNLLEIPKLLKGSDSSPITDATVSLTLTDTAGTNIVGQNWPLTLTYEAGSVARYIGTASYQLALTHNQRGRAIVVIDAGPGLRTEFSKPFRAMRMT